MKGKTKILVGLRLEDWLVQDWKQKHPKSSLARWVEHKLFDASMKMDSADTSVQDLTIALREGLEVVVECEIQDNAIISAKVRRQPSTTTGQTQAQAQ